MVSFPTVSSALGLATRRSLGSTPAALTMADNSTRESGVGDAVVGATGVVGVGCGVDAPQAELPIKPVSSVQARVGSLAHRRKCAFTVPEATTRWRSR